jgi:hypothetical protein
MKTQPMISINKPIRDAASVPLRQAAFRVGQIIDAFTSSDSRNGRISLHLGDREVIAATQIALPKDRRLLLQVVQIQPRILLKIIPPPSPDSGTAALRKAMLIQLPRQQALAPLLTSLAFAASAGNGTNAMQSLTQLAESLINAIPERTDVTRADGLRQAILQSGILLEAGLTRSDGEAGANVSSDIKALLLRLLSILEKPAFEYALRTNASAVADTSRDTTEVPPPQKHQPVSQPRARLNTSSDDAGIAVDIPALYKKAQGALARIVLHQIASSDTNDAGALAWRLELPVRQQDAVDIVSISIEDERNHAEESEAKNWVVNLAVELPVLGALHVRVGLYQHSITSTFWCESPGSVELIENRLAELRTRLEKQGLKTLNLGCLAGSPPARESSSEARVLLDEHA